MENSSRQMPQLYSTAQKKWNSPIFDPCSRENSTKVRCEISLRHPRIFAESNGISLSSWRNFASTFALAKFCQNKILQLRIFSVNGSEDGRVVMTPSVGYVCCKMQANFSNWKVKYVDDRSTCPRQRVVKAMKINHVVLFRTVTNIAQLSRKRTSTCTFRGENFFQELYDTLLILGELSSAVKNKIFTRFQLLLFFSIP